MDVSSVAPPATPSFLDSAIPSNRGRMDTDMDVDMDIDLGADLDVPGEDAMAIETAAQHVPFQSNAQVEGGHGNSGMEELAQEKVHIRGLDHLATEDVKSFASEHFPVPIIRLEWIDDTSANFVFESAEVASQALESFTNNDSDLDVLGPLDLRKAKPMSTHPDANLQVRIALATDVKKRGARDASRFYLMNPDKDPLERRRQQQNRNGDRRRKRQREEDDVPFDVNMYDDDPDSLAARRPTIRARRDSRNGYDSEDSRRYKRSRHRDDLFADRLGKGGSGQLRDRSASPVRAVGDGDGRLGFDEDEFNTRRARRRSISPAGGRWRSNTGKELIGQPDKPSTGILQAASNGGRKELFADRALSQEPATKELFPRKTATGNHHRRSAAFDAADATGDLFPNFAADKRGKGRSLAERITGGPEDGNSRGSQADGINIRGAAEETPGFSIRGTAKALGYENPRIKELFPDRGGDNAGKELFGSTAGGRGGSRKRAEDLF